MLKKEDRFPSWGVHYSVTLSLHALLSQNRYFKPLGEKTNFIDPRLYLVNRCLEGAEGVFIIFVIMPPTALQVSLSTGIRGSIHHVVVTPSTALGFLCPLVFEGN